MVVTFLLNAAADTCIAQEYQRNFGKDVHVTRERQREEKDAERNGIEPPHRKFAVNQQAVGKRIGKQFAGRVGQETAAADSRRDNVHLVAQSPADATEFPQYAAGETLGQQTGREDEPQGGECDAVPEHMLGRASHAHCPRADPFEKGQADPDQDEQQQGVFNQ